MADFFSDEKIRRFALAYVRTGNASLSYRMTLEDPRSPSTATASNEGWKLLHDERTQAFLTKLRERAAEKAATSLGEWLANELRIARFDPARLFDEEGNLLPIQDIDPDTRAVIQQIDVVEEVSADGTITRVKKIKLHSKDGAQDRLAKHLGAYNKDNEQKRVPYEDALRLLHGLPVDD